MQIFDLDTLVKDIKEKAITSLDFKKIFSLLFNRQKIDMITRVNENEIDDISRLAYFAIKQSQKLKALAKENNKNISELDLKRIMSNPNLYLNINLSLRLSKDSESRKEAERILTNAYNKELDIKQQQLINQQTQGTQK